MEKLRRLRTERGLSQAKLAARAELDPSTVNQIERGAREASPATLRKLAEALDVGIAELLEDASPKAPSRSSLEPSFNGLLEDERRRAEYAPRIWARIHLLERAAEQWQRFTDEGRYDLQTLDLENLKAIDAVSLNIVINHSKDVRHLKHACTPEQLERLENAEKRYFDANLEFWAQVENTLARQRVSDLTERRAELQARKAEMERFADLA